MADVPGAWLPQRAQLGVLHGHQWYARQQSVGALLELPADFAPAAGTYLSLQQPTRRR